MAIKRRKSVRRRSTRKVSRRRLHGLGAPPQKHEFEAVTYGKMALADFQRMDFNYRIGRCNDALDDLAMASKHMGHYLAHTDESGVLVPDLMRKDLEKAYSSAVSTVRTCYKIHGYNP